MQISFQQSSFRAKQTYPVLQGTQNHSIQPNRDSVQFSGIFKRSNPNRDPDMMRQNAFKYLDLVGTIVILGKFLLEVSEGVPIDPTDGIIHIGAATLFFLDALARTRIIGMRKANLLQLQNRKPEEGYGRLLFPGVEFRKTETVSTNPDLFLEELNDKVLLPLGLVGKFNEQGSLELTGRLAWNQLRKKQVLKQVRKNLTYVSKELAKALGVDPESFKVQHVPLNNQPYVVGI